MRHQPLPFMEEQDIREVIQPPKRRRRRWRVIVPVLLFLLLAAFFGVFFSFNYFGERFLRKYLQEKIYRSSNGLYRADFKTLQVNILTGKVVIDSFELIPNELQYSKLKALGRVARSLYRISFSSLTVDRVRFRQIYSGRRINFKQLTVMRPHLSIVGFPDTIAAKRNKWRVIYDDLYPAVSGLFNDFHIDSVKVKHGMLYTSFGGKTGMTTTGVYEFSSVMKDVSVNPFSYYNHDRVFYSRDVDLVVHNFESQLADSLYLLKAEEIGFSLTKSVLYGKKVSLVPNFRSKRIRQVHGGDLFRIDLPAFSIRGIDLYRAMTGREVAVSAVNLSDFFVRVYRNKLHVETETSRKAKKKLTLAGLYTVVAKELRFIAIDTLNLKNGSFEYYGSVTDSRPEMKVGTVNLELSQFRLDSLSHLDPSRIFYSHAIELGIEKFTLYLGDGIHCINASAVNFSTRKSLIDVHEVFIFPDRKKNLAQPENRRNIMFVGLPRLTFTGIDLKKVFNRRILDFHRLTILEPEISFTRYRHGKNPDPRFKNPEDFFETENEEFVYDLLKKYLWVVKGEEIDINRGMFKFSLDRNGAEVPVATSNFDLSMQQFLIDSVHGLNEQGYFYSRDFDLDLQSVSVVSPDSLKHLQAKRVHIATADSLIEAENIRAYKSAGPGINSSRPYKRQSVDFEFSLQKLRLTGLNHKKLFLEKVLKANQIEFDNPSVYLKTNSTNQPEGPAEATQLLKTSNVVRRFEIGSCLVRKGAFSYDGEEDRKASYFSLKDIDFTVINAIVHIPGSGMHDGLIKFDSLRLKVFPLRAVIADSAYALEAKSLEMNSYPADITLKGIKVTPLQSWNEIPGRKMMATITVPEMRFKGFSFERAIFDNEWLLESLEVDHPSVAAEIRQEEARPSGGAKVEPAGIIRLPPFMKTVSVGKVDINGARAGVTLHRAGKTSSYAMADLMVAITRFRVDSATRSNPASTPLFNARDITISGPGFSRVSADSMYTYTIGHFRLSTGSSGAELDSVSVTPNFNRYDFSRRKGYQVDRSDLKIPRITIHHLDFKKFLSQRMFHANRVNLEKVKFESYLDKRWPDTDWKRPLMPGRMIAGITFPAGIDTIAVSDGFASYEEQTGDEPGRVFFDRMNVMVTGFSTFSMPKPIRGVSGILDVRASFRLMGSAPVDALIHFQTDHPRDTFNLQATVGSIDLTAINPMLSKLEPMAIQSGTATSTEIVRLNGNSARASGIMNLKYNNLAINLKPVKPGTWSRIEQSLLGEVVNLLLADANPNDNGKMKYGIIYFERDSSRGFFNFVWKSVLSGLKSSVGVNSKTQKELKKQIKPPKK
ncbi:MAG: DUF748 domain-containing protein [Bacteroidales bacterium]